MDAKGGNQLPTSIPREARGEKQNHRSLGDRSATKRCLSLRFRRRDRCPGLVFRRVLALRAGVDELVFHNAPLAAVQFIGFQLFDGDHPAAPGFAATDQRAMHGRNANLLALDVPAFFDDFFGFDLRPARFGDFAIRTTQMAARENCRAQKPRRRMAEGCPSHPALSLPIRGGSLHAPRQKGSSSIANGRISGFVAIAPIGPNANGIRGKIPQTVTTGPDYGAASSSGGDWSLMVQLRSWISRRKARRRFAAS